LYIHYLFDIYVVEYNDICDNQYSGKNLALKLKRSLSFYQIIFTCKSTLFYHNIMLKEIIIRLFQR